MTTANLSTATTSFDAMPPGPLGASLHYAVRTATLTLKTWSYVLFTIGMPVILYLVFNGLWGSQPIAPGVNYSAIIMVQMAAYGALGAAMSGGAVIALERRSGWFRQLMITSLPPRSFLIARSAVVLSLVLPSLILVFTAGFVFGGVRAPVSAWVVSLLLMWAALAPLAILGLVIGLWVRGEAVQGLTTLILLLLSLAGGLWFPAEMMPPLMQTTAKFLPSYWIAEFGRWPFLAGPFPWLGVLVLAVWAVVLVFVGALGYRRAARNSKR